MHHWADKKGAECNVRKDVGILRCLGIAGTGHQRNFDLPSAHHAGLGRRLNCHTDHGVVGCRRYGLGYESFARQQCTSLIRSEIIETEASDYSLPNRRPAKRVRFGKEEQRCERALTLKKVGASDIKLAPTRDLETVYLL